MKWDARPAFMAPELRGGPTRGIATAPMTTVTTVGRRTMMALVSLDVLAHTRSPQAKDPVR